MASKQQIAINQGSRYYQQRIVNEADSAKTAGLLQQQQQVA